MILYTFIVFGSLYIATTLNPHLNEKKVEKEICCCHC